MGCAKSFSDAHVAHTLGGRQDLQKLIEKDAQPFRRPTQRRGRGGRVLREAGPTTAEAEEAAHETREEDELRPLQGTKCSQSTTWLVWQDLIRKSSCDAWGLAKNLKMR